MSNDVQFRGTGYDRNYDWSINVDGTETTEPRRQSKERGPSNKGNCLRSGEDIHSPLTVMTRRVTTVTKRGITYGMVNVLPAQGIWERPLYQSITKVNRIFIRMNYLSKMCEKI